jgi:hypothetical protein
MSLDTFEQSLLAELRQHVAVQAMDRSAATTIPRRRWTVGLTAGGLLTAAAAVAISVGMGAAGNTAAYAVEPQPDGDVTVTVYDLSDAGGLVQALASKGVEADVTHVRGFSQSDGQAPSTSGDGDGCAIAVTKINGGLRFTLGARQVAGSARLDIVTSGSSPADVGSPVAVTWAGGFC